jgi:hypothetical protein
MIYVPLARLGYWQRKFGVVIAGAILEHLKDPISVIGDLCRLANEAVIIAFTPVLDDERLFMEAANDWTNPAYEFTFWTLSSGLYRNRFAVAGFDVEFVEARARTGGVEFTRPTLIARRRAS